MAQQRQYRMAIMRNGKLVGTRTVSGVSRQDAYIGLCLKHWDAQKIDRNGRLILRFPETNEEWELFPLHRFIR